MGMISPQPFTCCHQHLRISFVARPLSSVHHFVVIFLLLVLISVAISARLHSQSSAFSVISTILSVMRCTPSTRYSQKRFIAFSTPASRLPLSPLFSAQVVSLVLFRVALQIWFLLNSTSRGRSRTLLLSFSLCVFW